MTNAAEMKERHEAGLAELADMGLSLARDLHARALAADDAAACDLSLAFQRVSRSVRQTYALELRLERERRLADRDLAAEAARERLICVQKKRRQLRCAVSALIWTEYEGDEAQALDEALETLVLDQAQDEDAFLETPLSACIDAIRADLGLPANDAAAPRPTEILIRRSSG